VGGEIGKHASLRGWCAKYALGGSSPLPRTKLKFQFDILLSLLNTKKMF